MLPRIEFSLCLLTKGKDVGLQFVVLIKLTLLVDEPADDLLPLVFKFFGCFSVVPTALFNSFGHYEEYTIDKSIACPLAFTQLSEYLLLNSADNRDIRSLDED